VDGSYLTAEDDLQDKKDRYYFTESIALDDTEVYVSKLDLNIENGEIEQPLKPMLRLGVPCHGSDGELLGVIVINYLADDLLDAIRSAAAGSNGSLFILNSEGYWIVNSADSDTEWAFMYDGAENVTFARRFPEAWDAVRTNSNGYAVTQNGVFIHTDVFLNTALEVENCKYSLVLGDGNLHIVSYIPADSSAGELFYKTWLIEFGEILTDNAFVYLLLLALAVALGLFIGISQSEKKEIRYFSEYDALTGVLNRRAAFQRLNQLSRLAHGEGKPISICFLDINGLKEVNDTLGHDAGDELIVSVADGVKATVRSNDVVARLGGDEFLVAFWDADADRAMRIWERIGSVYRQINETENRAYVVSVSCGIESLSPDSKISVEDALNLADEKMYANKREMKKTLRVVRESEQSH
jgi:diguanylate cyclase (GGDEF)-like protein